MDRPASIPQHIWDSLSGEGRALIGAVIDGLERQIAELKQQVQVLKARFDQNSTNSSKPPSTDPIGIKRKPPAPPSKQRRGGQKGHPRRLRALVPPERVASVTECKPTQCRRCGHPLSGVDAEPRRHQVAELPPIEPEVHEYRLHRLCCPHCHVVTTGVLPDGVPSTAFGPRLHAALSVLSGAYRLSKRQVSQLGSDLLGLTISLGMIAKLERITADVLEPPVAELTEQVRTAGAANIDETGWREGGCKAWLWVVVTSLGIVFRVVRSRSGAVARDLLGEEPKLIVNSDRFPGYEWIELGSRQICWAHLRRDMQAMIDRDGDGVEVGRQLLWQSNKLFESWHKVRDGTIQRSTFLQTVAWLRPMVRLSLERGSGCACAKTATTCGELLRLWECLWTFTRVEGVEPTNNAAERALRHAVIWRRISGGTDSEGGSRFVERMLSVVRTCRQQGRSALEYLTLCHRSRLDGTPTPSLLTTPDQLKQSDRAENAYDFCIPSWTRTIIPGRSPVQPKSASSGMPPNSCGRLPSEISKGVDGGGMYVQASMPRLDRWGGRCGRPAPVKARRSASRRRPGPAPRTRRLVERLGHRDSL